MRGNLTVMGSGVLGTKWKGVRVHAWLSQLRLPAWLRGVLQTCAYMLCALPYNIGIQRSAQSN